MARRTAEEASPEPGSPVEENKAQNIRRSTEEVTPDKVTQRDNVMEAWADRVKSFFKDLPVEAALTLKRDLGLVIPLHLVKLPTSKRRWGYICKNCQRAAFEFVGDQFVYKTRAGDLAHSDSPPLGVPLNELPWIQDDPNATWRNPPDDPTMRCQFCQHEVPLDGNRSLRPKRIQTLEQIQSFLAYKDDLKRRRGR